MPKKKSRIVLLLVEDEAPLREGLTDKFTREGFRVMAAKDGQEGLALALEHHPDLIFLDILMPKMDGLSFLRKLREDRWGKEAPCIIWSNSRDIEKVKEAERLGVTDFLVKSDWTFSDLVEKVEEKLGSNNST